MDTLENHSTGPRTDEGKLRSSQNSLKHGIFSLSILIPGETQEEFDQHLARYNADYRPQGAPEEDLVRVLAETAWRRRRLPGIEAQALGKSLETGDIERKFLNTYGIYQQRLNRTFQIALQALHQSQAKRLREDSLNFRMAMMAYHHAKTKGIPWKPSDDGFVFSLQRVERQFDLHERLLQGNKLGKIDATDRELDEFFGREAA